MVSIGPLPSIGYNAAEHGLTDRDFHDSLGSLNGVALADVLVRTQQDGADQILLEVLGHAIYAAVELEQLAGHTILQSVDVADTVTDGNDRADVRQLDLGLVVCDLLFDYCANLIRA